MESNDTFEFTTSGFSGGAKLLKDINTTESPSGNFLPGSFPSNFTEFDSRLFFTANDGLKGEELWVSDGTADGTQLLKDINTTESPSGNYPVGSYVSSLTEVDGKLFFTADDGLTSEELWVSDGTADGTQLLKDINPTESLNSSRSGSFPSYLTEFSGKLLFTASDGFTGNELWVSDGTADGTQLLKDINTTESLPGNFPSGAFPSNFTEFDGKLFFTADDGLTSEELWVSDGTADGTQLLKDINTGSGSFPSYLTEVDGKLFFTANDGLTGNELWVSDGTADGTQLLKDINTGSSSYASSLTEFDGKLFFTANDGITGNELWVSDGTADGTQLLTDINPSGSFDPSPFIASNLTEFDGKLFFSINDGVTGNELWVSDGTIDGTQLLKDINFSDNVYVDTSGLSDLTLAGDFLFFTANDGFTGRELWISDGTAAGTQLFQDINPGATGSNPENLSVLGDQLLFTADDGITGNELWTATIPDNLVTGDENNNVLNGTAGIDFINGLAGNDIIKGLNGNDLLNGGSDDDVLAGNGGDDTLNGNDDNDRLFGGQGNDELRGGAGDDLLEGGVGDDLLEGGAGDDTVIVRNFNGIDTFDGGDGNDLIRFIPSDDRNLTIFLEEGVVGDRRRGGQTFTNFEEITTGRGNDRLLGNDEANSLNGGAGNDQIRGGAGNDTIEGGVGDDTIEGGAGDDTVIVRNFSGVDSFDGGEGNDLIQFIPSDGRDLTIFLDRGNVGDGRRGGQTFTNFEEITTGRGSDRLLGNDEANTLNGGNGNDELIGGAGDDILLGSQGVDVLEGGIGNDELIGGGGVDTYRFADDLLDGIADTDTIQTFESQDILDFSAYVDAGGSIGATRLTSESLRLDLSGEDTVDIFGSAFALNVAESQIQ